MEDLLKKHLSSGTSATGWRAPAWSGWLALGVLAVIFGLLVWWLFFSPLSHPVRRNAAQQSRRTRRAVAVLMLLGTGVGSVGARWDELWHSMYSGFGNDFLWPPHMLLYGSLALTGAFAVSGLTLALRSAGGVRERFRAEPLMGLLGLISAYQIASIPSDLLWHRIIGPDISAWSLPHLLMALIGFGGKLAGMAMALSTLSERPWRPLSKGLSGMESVALAILGFAGLSLLQLGVTEWEWLDGPPKLILQRPVWAYPVVVLLVGITVAYLALYMTRRIGAATAVSLGMLLVHGAWVLYDRAAVSPGPIVAAHVILVLPALALDIWHARQAAQADSSRTLWGGTVLYAVVYLFVAFPYIAGFLTVPALNSAGRVQTAAACLAAAVVAGPMAARLGAWLAGFSNSATVAAPAATPRSAARS